MSRAQSDRLAGDRPALAADSAELADASRVWKSAYVHIPFCLRRCPYCDFAIVDESKDGRSLVARYVAAIHHEIGMEPGIGALDAINFGGGTPSRLDPEELGSIVQRLGAVYGIAEDVEISLEANPEDWTDAMADGLVAAGFTRVSLGAQSFDEDVLGLLGRNHAPDEVARAVESARRAGFSSVSVDLIFGHGAESDASWERSVERALSLEPDHVSTYALTVEPGTDLARAVAEGETPPDGDIQADRYELFLDTAERSGLRRYEVSNHARAGHACRYNLSTWNNGEYVAFGLGAHDHHEGERSRNKVRIDNYLADVDAGTRPRAGVEVLDAADEERDRLMLGLRLACGAAMTPLAELFLASDAGRMFLSAGIVAVVAQRIVVLKPMLTDAVVREALSVSAGDC
jgi:oxygen-independent coproporphyrinogen-3 oxidase